MGKKFVGLDGLKHFWTKAKTWIAGQITAEVTAKIAELVADAPEDLDTLKEIADWIKNHANSAAEMNSRINSNRADINTHSNQINSLFATATNLDSRITSNRTDIDEIKTRFSWGEISIYRETFNILRPVGSTYVQFPNQLSPNELWGEISQWSVINYDGAFFRAEGTDANPFLNSSDGLYMQQEGLPNIKGKIGTGRPQGWTAEGAFYFTGDPVERAVEYDTDEHKAFWSWYFSASRSSSIYGQSAHVTPKNYTIRIWKRIA